MGACCANSSTKNKQNRQSNYNGKLYFNKYFLLLN